MSKIGFILFESDSIKRGLRPILLLELEKFSVTFESDSIKRGLRRDTNLIPVPTLVEGLNKTR